MTGLPAGIIIAGGQARRMGGGDKCLLPLNEKQILSYVVARLAPQVSALCLNANGPPERFAEYGLPVLPDPIPGGLGPLAGLLAGLNWAAELGHDYAVSVAADSPFFPNDLVAKLQSHQSRPIAIAMSADDSGKTWPHPTFGLWPVALRSDLRQALTGGTRKIMQWANAHGVSKVYFDRESGRDPFFNINTPQDLVRASS